MDDVKPAILKAVYMFAVLQGSTPRTVLKQWQWETTITTDAPGCKETVKDGINGYIVKLNHRKL